MAIVKCTICGGSHPKWDCTKPMKMAAGEKETKGGNALISSQPSPMPSSGSSSKSKDVEEPALRKGHEVSRGAERKEQHPTHKPKIGRPKTGFDRVEYQRLYMRDKAIIKRLGLNCTVKEWREKNGLR